MTDHSNKVFCYAPWTNVGVSPFGAIKPCCKFNTDAYEDGDTTVFNGSISKYKQSEMVKTIKTQFENNTWPIGCKICQQEEAVGTKSKRIMDYERWSEHYATYDFNLGNTITADIVLGTTCNLKCIMCNPVVSSKWRKEWNVIYGTSFKDFKYIKTDVINDFLDNGPDLRHIDFAGGEPLLSGVDEQRVILKHYIDSGNAHNMTLHYTTNATIYPDSEWWDIWSHFKEVDIQLSIDGIGARFEYQRFPGKWNDIESIVKKFVLAEKQIDNIRLSVSHTVSAYNIYYLDEFLTWNKNAGLPEPWIGAVYKPKHLLPGVWPDPIKEKIIEHMKGSTSSLVHHWADVLADSTFDSDQFDKFLKFTADHNEYRGNSIADNLSELSDIIELHGIIL